MKCMGFISLMKPRCIISPSVPHHLRVANGRRPGACCVEAAAAGLEKMVMDDEEEDQPPKKKKNHEKKAKVWMQERLKKLGI